MLLLQSVRGGVAGVGVGEWGGGGGGGGCGGRCTGSGVGLRGRQAGKVSSDQPLQSGLLGYTANCLGRDVMECDSAFPSTCRSLLHTAATPVCFHTAFPSSFSAFDVVVVVVAVVY